MKAIREYMKTIGKHMKTIGKHMKTIGKHMKTIRKPPLLPGRRLRSGAVPPPNSFFRAGWTAPRGRRWEVKSYKKK